MFESGISTSRPLAPAAQIPHTTALLRTVGWSLVAVICAEYVFYFATLSTFPLQDFPNHLARGAVISDLLFDHGARYGRMYSLQLMPLPYVLHDLLLAAFIKLFGLQAGGALFVVLVLLSMPLALMFYMRAVDLAPRAKQMVFLLGLYLSTDCFFLFAFMGFRLALALLLVSLALVELLRRQWSQRLFWAYAAVLLIGYLTHLTATVFFAVALGASSTLRLWMRTSTLRREAQLWTPLAALLVLHALFLSGSHSPADPPPYEFDWGTWHEKFQHLRFDYLRYGSRLDQPMFLMLLVCLLWPLRSYLRLDRLTHPAVLEPFLIAAAFLGVYFFLPRFYPDSAFVDVRALPVVLLMLLIAALNVPGPGSSGRAFNTWPMIGLAFLLALMNFTFLVKHIGKYESLLTRYRAVGDVVPAGSYVLPVNTIPKDGSLRPLLHAGAYLVTDRNSVIPYLFGGDRGDPMKYFRYRQRPYRPEEEWYRAQLAWSGDMERTYMVAGRPYTWKFKFSQSSQHWETAELIPIDWNRVACQYDFLLMTQPINTALIGVPTRWIRSNEAAALLAVDKSACRPDEISNELVKMSSEH
jgi:hypothetical protein